MINPLLKKLQRSVGDKSLKYTQPTIKYHRFINWLLQENITEKQISTTLNIPIELVTIIRDKTYFEANPNDLVRLDYAIEHLLHNKQYHEYLAINKTNKRKKPK